MNWRELARRGRDILDGMAIAGYRRQLRAEAIDLQDLFLLLCYMEALGLPNPAALYLLDVHPYFLEELHLWHRRMGMDRSPLATFRCC
ncbi:MAG: helicase [Acidobacteria bacterium]|nr:helicase [Acidobacteriota bacterium]